MFSPLISINTADNNTNDLLAKVRFTVEFDVPRADAHDFDDAVRMWARDWKSFSIACHADASSKDKETCNG